MKLQTLPLLLVAVCLTTAFADRPGDFRVIGPGGGGAMFNPTISPHDPNTVLISCDMTGSYITHDGGKSWRMFNLRGVVRFFVFDPLDAKTMYAYATGLWRSTDGGEQWSLVYPSPSAVKGVKMDSDHADEQILADPDPLGAIATMTVDPANSKILYVAAGAKESPALYVSRDYGKTWQKQAGLTDLPRRVWVDPHSAPDSRKIFLAGTQGISVVSASDVHSFPAPAAFTDISLGFGAGPQPTIYATSEQGAFVSIDGGATWRNSALPGKDSKVRAIATSFRHPETAYVSYNELALDGKTWMGVAKTTNSGGDWQLVWKDSDVGATNVHDAWITPRFGPIWGENPLNLTVSDKRCRLGLRHRPWTNHANQRRRRHVDGTLFAQS